MPLTQCPAHIMSSTRHRPGPQITFLIRDRLLVRGGASLPASAGESSREALTDNGLSGRERATAGFFSALPARNRRHRASICGCWWYGSRALQFPFDVATFPEIAPHRGPRFTRQSPSVGWDRRRKRTAASHPMSRRRSRAAGDALLKRTLAHIDRILGRPSAPADVEKIHQPRQQKAQAQPALPARQRVSARRPQLAASRPGGEKARFLGLTLKDIGLRTPALMQNRDGRRRTVVAGEVKRMPDTRSPRKNTLVQKSA